jgi:hypothetical protein
MRTLRLSLVGTVMLVLLGGLGSAVMAQDAEDTGIAATHVTGRTTANRIVSPPTYTGGYGYAHNTGYGGVYERDVDWSDPRLPSLMRLSESWDFYSVGDASDEFNGAISLVQNVRLDSPDGAWTGTAYGLLEETKPVARYPQTLLMVLGGAGAYEGLSAMLRATYEEPPAMGTIADWEGYILEGGMTPIPEAPEPPAR